jgi:hypothetical protein
MANDPTKELALMEKRFDETIEMVESGRKITLNNKKNSKLLL